MNVGRNGYINEPDDPSIIRYYTTTKIVRQIIDIAKPRRSCTNSALVQLFGITMRIIHCACFTHVVKAYCLVLIFLDIVRYLLNAMVNITERQ